MKPNRLRRIFATVANLPHAPRVLLAFLVLYIPFSLGFSASYAAVTADHIVPVFISIVKWTPFYWGSDRFGTALPALFSWVTSFPVNFALQSAACIGLLLVSEMLACRIFDKETDAGTLTVSLLVFVLAFQPQLFTVYGTNMSYAQGMGFLFAGISLYTARKRANAFFRIAATTASLLCIYISIWICFSIIVAIPFLIILLHGNGMRKKDLFGLAVASVLGFVLLFFYLRAFSGKPASGNYAFTFSTASLVAMRILLEDAVRYFLPGVMQKAFVLAGCGATAVLVFKKHFSRKQLFMLLVLVLFFATECVIAATNTWVAANDYKGRYLTVSATLLLFFLAYALSILIGSFGRTMFRVATIMLLLLLFVQVSPNWPAACRSIVGKNTAAANELLALDCTAYAGEYWTSWPVVLAANTLGQGAPGFAPIQNISQRSEAIEDILRTRIRAGNGVICVPNTPDLGGAPPFFEQYGIVGETAVVMPHTIAIVATAFAGSPTGADKNAYLAAMHEKYEKATYKSPLVGP